MAANIWVDKKELDALASTSSRGEEKIGKRIDPIQGMELKPDTINLVVGKTGSGKTHLLRNIIRNNTGPTKGYHAVFVLHSTLDTQTKDKHMYNFIPSRFKKYPKSNEELNKYIDQIVTFQREHKDEDSRVIVILDDIVGIADVKGKFWKQIGASSRGDRITFVVLLQSLQGIDTVFRDAADSIWLLRMGGNSLTTAAKIVDMKEHQLKAVIKEAEEDNERNVIRLYNRAAMSPSYFLSPPSVKFWRRYIH